MMTLHRAAGKIALLAWVAAMGAAVAPVHGQQPPAAPARQAAETTRPSRCASALDMSYADLVQQYGKNSPAHMSSDGAAGSPVELMLMRQNGVEDPVDPRMAVVEGECYQMRTTTLQLAADGTVRSFDEDSGGVRGGSGILPPAAHAAIDRLVEELPPDGQAVPPASRRLVVVAARNGSVTVRLYDVAHLPDRVLELVRLTGARVDVLSPELEPAETWSGEEANAHSPPPSPAWMQWQEPIVESPDGSMTAVHNFVGHVLEIYQGSEPPDNSYRVPGRVVERLPEFWQAQWGDGEGFDTKGRFSLDGRYLLVEWGRSLGSVLYDTRSWEPVTDPSVFPQHLQRYEPSPDWRFGVAVDAHDQVFLWNFEAHRRMPALEGIAKFDEAVLSPDGTKVAVYRSPELQKAEQGGQGKQGVVDAKPGDDAYLTVWDTQTGARLHDLWPTGWDGHPESKPLWWGGDWVLAPYRSMTGDVGGLGLWDATTGRFLGKLREPKGRQCTPVAAEGKLVERCLSGEVSEWSEESVERQVKTPGELSAR